MKMLNIVCVVMGLCLLGGGGQFAWGQEECDPYELALVAPGADLSYTVLSGCDLSGRDLSDTYLWGGELLNVHAEAVNFTRAFFGNAALSGFFSGEFSFSDFWLAVVLPSTILAGNFQNANFSDATLPGVIFIGEFCDAAFDFANLTGADFTGAACLESSSFHGATLEGTIFPPGFSPPPRDDY